VVIALEHFKGAARTRGVTSKLAYRDT